MAAMQQFTSSERSYFSSFHRLCLNKTAKKRGLVYVTYPNEQPSIESTEIGTGELVHISTKKSTPGNSGRITLSDIDDDRFISISNTGSLGDLLSQRFAEEKKSPTTFIHAQTYYLARNLVARGLGHSILDEFTVNAPGVDQVFSVGFEPPIEFKPKCFYHASQPLSTTSTYFIHCIKQSYQELHPAKSHRDS